MPNQPKSKGDDKNFDQLPPGKPEEEKSSFSLGSLSYNQDVRLSQGNSSAYTYAFGQLPDLAFRIHKSEFPLDTEKQVELLKPLVNGFLNETNISSTAPPLSEAEKSQLNNARNALNKFISLNDLLEKAVNLAKIYHELRYIEEAKKAVNLSLGIDPDNPQAVQLFKEMEHMHPADIGIQEKLKTQNLLTKSTLRKCINNLSKGRVIVVGDLVIDELIEGSPERISREAPVLILEHVSTELILGGAANAANNIATLGGKCHAIGVCGNDEYSAKLTGLLEKSKITHGLVLDPHRHTTVKTRILSKSISFRQQLLRLDRVTHEKISGITETLLAEKIEQAPTEYSAIVISDYRAGAITNHTIEACTKLAQKHNMLVIVDAQDQFERFKNTALLTPNQPDVEAAVGFPITSQATLINAGEKLMSTTNSNAILITRGGAGMILFQPGQEPFELPVFNKSEVFDVTGAGDTVVAAMSLALVSGSSYLEAMALGNLAAGIVVKKPGTAVTNQQELLSALESVSLPE